MPGIKVRTLRFVQKNIVNKISNRLKYYLNPEKYNFKNDPFLISLAQGYKTQWKNSPCVFVLSTGRVGTQTLTYLFELSPQLEAFHEPTPRLIKTSFDAYMSNEDLLVNEKWKEIILAARDDLIFHSNRAGKIFVETNNRVTYLAEILASVFPQSRFIHLHRHPYEVIRSAMRRNYYNGHNWDFARIRPREDEPLFNTWDSLTLLEKNTWYWNRVNSHTIDFMATLETTRKLSINANDIFKGNVDVIKNMYDFVGADIPKTSAIEEVLGKKLNAETEGLYPLPSDWSTEELNAVKKGVAETAKKLGYSL